MSLCRLITIAILSLPLVTQAEEQPKNLLFFGNSFTLGESPWSVPQIVRSIATAAGHPTPHVTMRADGGASFTNHIANASTLTAINSLPAGSWDAFVLQDYSTRTTTANIYGANLTAHRTEAVTLAGLVLEHSSDAHPVLFQTWARSPASTEFYPYTFANAAAMQEQIRDGYLLSAGDVAAAYGRATIAPVGEAFQAYGWTGLYGGDEYHANNRGSLLAGMVLYMAIYDQPLTDVDLSGVLSYMGLPSTDAPTLKAAATAAVLPEPAGLASITMAGGILMVRRRRQCG